MLPPCNTKTVQMGLTTLVNVSRRLCIIKSGLSKKIFTGSLSGTPYDSVAVSMAKLVVKPV